MFTTADFAIPGASVHGMPRRARRGFSLIELLMAAPGEATKRAAFRAKPRAVRACFTLVELLMVIAIIAILVSMLMPALRRARRQAQEIQCLAKNRQVIMGIGGFLSDNNGLYPPMSNSLSAYWDNPSSDAYHPGKGTWHYLIAPYMGMRPSPGTPTQIWTNNAQMNAWRAEVDAANWHFCPLNLSKPNNIAYGKDWIAANIYFGFAFGWNWYYGRGCKAVYQSQVIQPRSSALFADRWFDCPTNGGGSLTSYRWNRFMNVEPGGGGGAPSYWHHYGRSSWGFADGHARMIHGDEALAKARDDHNTLTPDNYFRYPTGRFRN